MMSLPLLLSHSRNILTDTQKGVCVSRVIPINLGNRDLTMYGIS